jgi:hypothetical protein
VDYNRIINNKKMERGFYKYDNGDLFYAPNFVDAQDYTLLIEDYQTYSYPIHGWYYFESDAEAKYFFNIKE